MNIIQESGYAEEYVKEIEVTLVSSLYPFFLFLFINYISNYICFHLVFPESSSCEVTRLFLERSSCKHEQTKFSGMATFVISPFHGLQITYFHLFINFSHLTILVIFFKYLIVLGKI